MGRSTVHYADNKTNNALKKLHNKLRPAGTPVQRVEYIIELLLLRIFETKIKQDDEFKPLRKLFTADYLWLNPKTGLEESNENRLFSYLVSLNQQIITELNDNFFPFYSTILQSARKVFEGNLPQKVQDQLVLIEEVFSNSNFTNNVNGGNIGEVISIVANEIEESRLLKTDLLGDAIESALSETGGTKDVGLFRTPDHIRQFMTAIVEPTFDDIIFDPACGTGGFLFDAFEFVMRRVDNESGWATEKAHTELAEWFNNYFKNNQLPFPSKEQTTQFYRGGVAGVEYLGMIRKMAAINFYIRGLNPANIEQGDSLALYNPMTDQESKSVILANPPFGAERDQEAYPEVWQEYSKESETTILFVKLMFEHLKSGGRCAVVVSEGFNTWDQFSAKALRKMLLDEANLKAVISLPQGLFVSKSGQGPKTSILIFEKGGKTDFTWFYKITNDGYTMGTNRKEQKGNQLVDCLNLWHTYVKKGIKPPETKNQFCIPAQWIKTLDPRIKQKIKTDTRADLEAKGKTERIKKEAELDKKIKAEKATKEDKQNELKLFNQMLENRIQNEIAKRIDKAHNYSFNLANYKSTISDSQIAEWQTALQHIQPNGATTLDDVYKKLVNGKVENILPYLLKLNPINALEADIAREYISNIPNETIAIHKELNVLKGILKSKIKYPIEKLEGKVVPKYVKIKKDNYDGEIDIVDKISFKDGKIHFREEKETGMDLYQAEKGDLVTSKINVHQGALALADRKLVCSTHYQIYEIDKTQINPNYLVIALRSKQLQNRVNEIRNNGIKNEQGADFLLSLEIPLPSIEEQNNIVAQIQKQNEIIVGAYKVLNNFEFEFTNVYEWKKESLATCCKQIIIGNTPTGKVLDEGEIVYLKVNNLSFDLSLDFKNKYYISSETHRKDLKSSMCYAGDVLMNIVGPPLGKVSIVPEEIKECNFNQAIICFRPKDYLDSRFLAYYLLKKSTVNRFIENIRRSTGQWNLTKTICSAFEIDFPDYETQQKIVAELDAQMNVLQGLNKLKSSAQNKVNQILADVWGIEFVEELEKKEELELETN